MTAVAVPARQALILDLAAEAVAARVARHLVKTELKHAGVGVELVGCAVQVVSELVTNALVHAVRRPSELPTYAEKCAVPVIHVAVRHFATCTVIEVWDPNDPPGIARVRAGADRLEESGRGMGLVRHLSTAWGQRRDRSGGKWVWARFDHPVVSEERSFV